MLWVNNSIKQSNTVQDFVPNRSGIASKSPNDMIQSSWSQATICIHTCFGTWHLGPPTTTVFPFRWWTRESDISHSLSWPSWSFGSLYLWKRDSSSSSKIFSLELFIRPDHSEGNRGNVSFLQRCGMSDSGQNKQSSPGLQNWRNHFPSRLLRW